jgi:hypothetical protein
MILPPDRRKEAQSHTSAIRRADNAWAFTPKDLLEV